MKTIRKDVREYILAEVNATLERLGISEPLEEQKEYTRKGEENVRYLLESKPIKQMPVMFKRLVVDGSMYQYFPQEKDRLFEIAKARDIIEVCVGYDYNHFGGGHNGCDLGTMIFVVKREIPETLEDYEDMSFYVRRYQGLEI